MPHPAVSRTAKREPQNTTIMTVSRRSKIIEGRLPKEMPLNYLGDSGISPGDGERQQRQLPLQRALRREPWRQRRYRLHRCSAYQDAACQA